MLTLTLDNDDLIAAVRYYAQHKMSYPDAATAEVRLSASAATDIMDRPTGGHYLKAEIVIKNG